MTMKYLSAILEYFNNMAYTHREDIPIILSEYFEKNKSMTSSDFNRYVRKIKSDFFRINNINRNEFSENIYNILVNTKEKYNFTASKYDVAKKFIEKYILIGLEKNNEKDRQFLINIFHSLQNPHKKMIEATNDLLQKISQTYQLNLHGSKEYSGTDIIKTYKNSTIAIQIKTKSDDIKEDRIRSQTSKAYEHDMSGFIMIFARKATGSVATSIQAAYHHFLKMNQRGEMYCAVISPEILAELLLNYEISIKT